MNRADDVQDRRGIVQRRQSDQNVDLADSDDVNSINKVLDAENMATNNEPRVGVVRGLEARLAKASETPASDEDE
jgi:hypothetical protein